MEEEEEEEGGREARACASGGGEVREGHHHLRQVDAAVRGGEHLARDAGALGADDERQPLRQRRRPAVAVAAAAAASQPRRARREHDGRLAEVRRPDLASVGRERLQALGGALERAQREEARGALGERHVLRVERVGLLPDSRAPKDLALPPRALGGPQVVWVVVAPRLALGLFLGELDVALAPATRRRLEQVAALWRRHDPDVLDAERLAGAQHRRVVVPVLEPLEHHDDSCRAPLQDRLDPSQQPVVARWVLEVGGRQLG